MQQDSERVYNNTFRGQHPTDYNACVGNNGFQDTEDYIQGYIEAAKKLLDEIASKPAHDSNRDTIIYPIAFCIRHSLELCLKGAIESLRSIRDSHDLRSFKLSSTHDIGELWAFYKEQSEITDRRYIAINKKLSEYVSDIFEIDPNGQTFRYPVDLNNQKHLVKTPVINLILLRKRFIELSDLISELGFANRSLQNEYSQKTYTKSLSRYDLYCIALSLPKYHLWGIEKFKEIKEEIKTNYSIGSKEFSTAIDLIKENHELSSLVGIEKKLTYIEKEDIVHYFKQWLPYSQFNLMDDEFSVDAMMKHNEIELEYIEKCLEKISINGFAELHSLYELGNDHFPLYSEDFESILQSNLQDIWLAEREERVHSEIGEYLSKNTLMTTIYRALQILGQLETCQYLEAEFGELSDVEPLDLSNNYPYPLS